MIKKSPKSLWFVGEKSAPELLKLIGAGFKSKNLTVRFLGIGVKLSRSVAGATRLQNRT
jgi:hypothetical protein